MARKLKDKLDMPRPAAERELDEDLDMLDMEDEDLEMAGMEEDEEMLADADMEEMESPAMLEDISDDDLLAEARARGLVPEEDEEVDTEADAEDAMLAEEDMEMDMEEDEPSDEEEDEMLV